MLNKFCWSDFLKNLLQTLLSFIILQLHLLFTSKGKLTICVFASTFIVYNPINQTNNTSSIHHVRIFRLFYVIMNNKSNKSIDVKSVDPYMVQ